MANLGHFNTLTIVRQAPPGLYLDGGTHGEILLPRRYIPPGAKPGDALEVFVYRDSEDRLVATTETPLATVGQCAYLRVVSVKPGVGAFLSWGLEKDLLLPLREQTREVRPLDWVVVHIALDPKSDRIVATARLSRWLDLTPPTYRAGDPVKLLIESETPLGYRAIVGHTHRGMLFRSDLTAPLRIGQALDGFVRTVREDGKIDLGLEPVGYRRIAPLTEQIMEQLHAAGGRLPFHDKTPPAEIQAAFGASKKAFKQALGALYREQLIRMEPQGIRLAKAKG
jgi:predicted RNA-binding protein (virulence factor B family)